MPRTREQIERAAAEAVAWLDALEPASTPADDVSDLRAIVKAVTDVVDAERRLEAAVRAALANGRSWAWIGQALGTTKQAAAERFGGTAAQVR